MESNLPRSLEQYCQYYNCSFFAVHLPCIFCSHILTAEDLAAFACKNLSLVFRNAQCLACCIKCCRMSARYEIENYYQCSVRSVNIESVSQCRLHALIVRCYECLKSLDIAEKYDLVCKDEWFHVVRSQWRGLCRDCYPK